MKSSLYVFFPALFLFTTAGCGNKEEEPQQQENHTHENNGNIQLTEAQFQEAAIEFGSFSIKEESGGLSANAQLVIHPEHIAKVSAISTGVIEALNVSLNSYVKKGQVIAGIKMPELLDLQEHYLENRYRLVFLQTEFDRYKTLRESDATSLKNFQKAEYDLQTALNADKILSAKLRQYQIVPEKLNAQSLRTQVNLIAPVSGVVTNIFAGIGAAVETGSAICEISDMSQLHADIWIFEKDITKVKNGQKVSLSFPSDRTNIFTASIFSIDHQLDPERRALRAHARIESGFVKTGNLVNGSFLEASVLSSVINTSQALPEEAVIKEGTDDFIFILDAILQGKYEFRKVKVNRASLKNGLITVVPLESIPDTARIVLKGAYYVSAAGTGKTEEE
jgi:cobalt-zinc-cadmium efflux system membrane fusion protein